MNFQEGEILFIDKPLDWTSFDVVNKVRNAIRPYYGKTKVGHAGTLDPKATGLLIVATGRKTKTIDDWQGLDKGYSGELKLGQTSETYDSEGTIIDSGSTEGIQLEDLQKLSADFIGEQLQEPPPFSAVKVGGKKLYELARKGKAIPKRPRMVQIDEFNLESLNDDVVSFYVHCAKGTYIRSMVHDLGNKVGCGAYLMSLRRTKIGSITVEDARSLEATIDMIHEHGKQLKKE